VEIMVASAVMVMLLPVLFWMVTSASKNWSTSKDKAGAFREARDGFESMSRTISQATLNTYMDFVDSQGNTRFSSNANSTNFIPASYTRQSELRFISGPKLIGDISSTPARPTHALFFQGPLGMVTNQASYTGLENLLNTYGYYLEFNADSNRPSFISSTTPPPRYRFRLMQLMEPSENLSLYKYTAANPGLKSTDANGTNWFGDPLASANSRILAENILALILLPQLARKDEAPFTNNTTPLGTALAPGYTYDTTTNNLANPALNPHNQLPPQVQITMVALEESSYARIQGASSTVPTGIATALNNAPFTNSADYSKDLASLTAALQALRPAVGYRVFTTTVAIKAAKWSRSGN
jgi:uncharacterized protein (TIGR02599 family)